MIKKIKNSIDLMIICIVIAIGIVILNNYVNKPINVEAVDKNTEYCKDNLVKKEIKYPIMKSDDYPANSLIGNLYFPTLKIRTMIYQGDNLDGQKYAMDNGQAHDPATPLPGDVVTNASNNTVIAGHRHNDFKYLNELNPGDPIILEVNGNVFPYTFYDKKIITPDQIEEVFQFSSLEILTLYTCWPLDSNLPYNERLVISALPMNEVVINGCD